MLAYYERSVLTEIAGTTALVAGLALCIATLRSGSPAVAIAAAGTLVLGVSLRTVFLPAVILVASLAGVIGIRSGRPAGLLPPRWRPRAAALALVLTTIGGLATYALATGHLTGRRPSINPNGGFFVIGALSPLLEPVDFAGRVPGDAGALLAGTRHREWHLRNAQVFGKGLIVERLRQRLGGAREASDAARAVALAAVARDPAGFVRHVFRQAAEYFDGPLCRDRLPNWAGLDRPLPEDLVGDLRRRVFDPPAPDSPAVPSPALGYLSRSAPLLPAHVWAAIAVALCSIALLPRVPRDARPGCALTAGALLAYLGGVFAFSTELAPRYLFPLVPLTALGVGLLAAGLTQSRRGASGPAWPGHADGKRPS
jgi:hypothetical protein